VFHPQLNVQTDKTIQTLEGMLRACAPNYARSWDCNLPLMESAYNNGYDASISMTLFNALYDDDDVEHLSIGMK